MTWKVLAIALGAALGANLRYGVSLWAAKRWGVEFPFGTFLINVSGSFCIGLILTLGTTRLVLTEETRLFLVTGFLGGYTTFSTFSIEAVNLAISGRIGAALAYSGGSVVVGMAAAAAGIALASLGFGRK